MLVANIFDMEKPGKRDRTRLRLADAALDLFEAQGYDRTTTAQIAEVVGVSEMTLFRHYPSKDRLLLDDPYDPIIAESVAAQPAELPALERVTAGIRAAWRGVPQPAETAVRRRMRIAARTPSLTGAMRASTRATEQAVARSLIETGADPATARIAAAAVLAALTEALIAWAAVDEDGSLDDTILFALRVLEKTVR